MNVLDRVLNSIRRSRLDADLRQDVDTHLALLEEEELARGSTPEQAHRQARIRFGNPRLQRERTLDALVARSLERAAADLRHAFRAAWRSPGVTLVAVISLALGIGVNTAMFSVIHAVLLRPLPYANPEQLVRIVQRDGVADVTMPEYRVTREQTRVFAAVAAFRGAGDYHLQTAGADEWIDALRVSTDFLRALQVRPALGREFTEDETRTGGPQAIVVSEALWRRAFGADPLALGRPVTLDGTAYTLVGVLPESFWFPQRADALIPLRASGTLADLGTNTQLLARLKDGMALPQARADLDALTAAFRRARQNSAPASYRGPIPVSFHDSLVGDVRLNVLLVFGATGLVLLMACLNVAMLLMARITARRREIAVRLALGGSRRRLAAQFLAENLVVAMLGAAIAVAAAAVLVRMLLAWMPFTLPAAAPVSVNGTVLAFALLIGVLTAVLFTIGPLSVTRDMNVHAALKSAGDRTGGRGLQTRTRNALVIAEVALSATLLVAAGLLIQSLYNLHQVRLGFEPDGLLTFATPQDSLRRQTDGERVAFVHQLHARLAATPGVRGVAVTNLLPLTGPGNLPTQRDGHPEHSIGAMEMRTVSPDYFDVMGIALRRGRAFTPADTAGTQPVVIINETVARLWWPDGKAIGDHLVIGRFNGRRFLDDPSREVVAIAADTRNRSLTGPPRPTVFVPLEQSPLGLGDLSWIVNTNASAAALTAAVAGVDPAQRVLAVRPLTAIVGDTTATSQFNASLFGVFAGVAVGLALIGLYGVLSYVVAQRRQEIGTRMALGAGRAQVAALFLTQGALLTLGGLALGLGAAIGFSRWLSSLLFGVTARDPASFAAVAVILLAVGAAASYLPARRAANTDPMSALRAE